MKKISIGLICIIALGAVAVWASNALAYSTSANCKNCHDINGPGAAIHDDHNDFINQCNVCHQSTGDTPDINSSGNTLGYGCTGCHEPLGLWRHHYASGITSCNGCHGNPDPVVLESNIPPYYGTTATTIDDPCQSTAPPGEDGNNDGFGLDNDGDMQDERSQLQNKMRAMSILRARLYEIEEEKQHNEIAEERRSQVGSGDRSEKIRTYNYPQSRITDHRIGFTSHNLSGMMDGALDEILDELATYHEAEKLAAAGLRED